MAALTRAQMITKVLRRLRVIGADQTADASDASIVGQVLDSVHDQLRELRLAPFETSSIPAWAQEPFAKCVCLDAAPYFGLQAEDNRTEAERELSAQVMGRPMTSPTRIKSF